MRRSWDSNLEGEKVYWRCGGDVYQRVGMVGSLVSILSVSIKIVVG